MNGLERSWINISNSNHRKIECVELEFDTSSEELSLMNMSFRQANLKKEQLSSEKEPEIEELSSENKKFSSEIEELSSENKKFSSETEEINLRSTENSSDNIDEYDKTDLNCCPFTYIWYICGISFATCLGYICYRFTKTETP